MAANLKNRSRTVMWWRKLMSTTVTLFALIALSIFSNFYFSASFMVDVPLAETVEMEQPLNMRSNPMTHRQEKNDVHNLASGTTKKKTEIKNQSSKANRRKMQYKPWNTKAPIPTTLMMANNRKTGPIRQRHSCIERIRAKQLTIFQDLVSIAEDGPANHIKPEILLVDPAYHANVGDHMLTLGEFALFQNSLNLTKPAQCHYIQAKGYYPHCTKAIQDSGPKSKTKIALWQAGGNWGDLWPKIHKKRIPSFITLLRSGYKVIGLPQSLFYTDKTIERLQVEEIKRAVATGLEKELGNSMIEVLDTKKGIEVARSRIIFTWREKESYQQALKIYPFARNLLAPDMAFQLGPYSPIRNHPEKLVDVLLFLRTDKESKVQDQRTRGHIEAILPESKKGMSFEIVNWDDRMEIFHSMDHFFTDTAIQLLSLGKVMVCDRLHAAILSYLSGIPFVYIDQVSGKITKTLTAAFDGMGDCLDGGKAQWARATSLEEAIKIASEMIDEDHLDHGKA